MHSWTAKPSGYSRPVRADQLAVGIVDVESSGPVVRRGLAVESGIGSPLLFGQETDRAYSPLVSGEVCKTLSSATAHRT